MLYILNLVGISVTFFLYKNVKKYYQFQINHITIFTAVWLIVIIGSQAFTKSYFPSIEIIGISYLVLFVFLISSTPYTSKTVKTPLIIRYDIRSIKITIWTLFILTIISNFRLLLFLYKINFNFSEWANLRIDKNILDLIENEFLFNVFGRLYFLYIPLLIYAFKNKAINKFTFTFILSFSFLIAVTSFTRAPIIQLIIISIISYIFMYEKKISVIKILFLSLSFLGIFIFSQYILTENYLIKSTPIEQLKLYVWGGIKAYENIFYGTYYDSNFNFYDIKYYSSDFLNYILHKLGFIDLYPSYIREYDFNINTNVYTFLDALTLDFGILGALFSGFIYGFVPKKIFLLYKRNKSLFSLIIYSLLCYYMFMVFMNNEMIRFSFILIVFEALLIEFIIRKKK